MTAATAMKVGQAAGTYFLRGDHRHRVVIGKDTRLSGYMLENAMTAGFTSVGMDVVLLGPMPTPAVALLTREMRAASSPSALACPGSSPRTSSVITLPAATAMEQPRAAQQWPFWGRFWMKASSSAR